MGGVESIFVWQATMKELQNSLSTLNVSKIVKLAPGQSRHT